MALQVASVASGIRFSLRAISRDVASCTTDVAALLILLFSSQGTFPGDVPNLATHIALGIAVLTFVFCTLTGNVPALVAHIAGALRLRAVPGYVAHLGTVVA